MVDERFPGTIDGDNDTAGVDHADVHGQRVDGRAAEAFRVFQLAGEAFEAQRGVLDGSVVDEGQHHTLAMIAFVDIGVGLQQVADRAGELPGEGDATGDHARQADTQVAEIQRRRNGKETLAHRRRREIEQLHGRRVVERHAQTFVEHDQGMVQAVLDVAQVTVEPNELVGVGLEFLIDRGQLFIRRLQFFIGRRHSIHSRRRRRGATRRRDGARWRAMASGGST